MHVFIIIMRSDLRTAHFDPGSLQLCTSAKLDLFFIV